MSRLQPLIALPLLFLLSACVRTQTIYQPYCEVPPALLAKVTEVPAPTVEEMTVERAEQEYARLQKDYGQLASRFNSLIDAILRRNEVQGESDETDH